MTKKQDEALIELKRYLETFIKNFHGKTLHLIDISQHLSIIKDFQKRIK